jgi:hypothetical protein
VIAPLFFVSAPAVAAFFPAVFAAVVFFAALVVGAGAALAGGFFLAAVSAAVRAGVADPVGSAVARTCAVSPLVSGTGAPAPA